VTRSPWPVTLRGIRARENFITNYANDCANCSFVIERHTGSPVLASPTPKLFDRAIGVLRVEERFV
jgi:hypothetical protein